MTENPEHSESSEKKISTNSGEGSREKLNKWLIPGGRDELDSLKSQKLKRVLKQLAERPPSLISTPVLSNYYDKLLELTEDPSLKITDEDVAPYLAAIAEKAEELAGLEGQEKKGFLRELPLYIGAVFEGGRNEYLVEDPDLIPKLNVQNEDDRRVFIFENIHSFDYLFKNPSSWKAAVDLWLADFNIAVTKSRLNRKEIESFQKKLKAVMGVTASARAMEASSGPMGNYLTILTGVEGGDNDKQDIWASYLVHYDPEKLNVVIRDPLVKRYYDKLMKDAGLINQEHEWRETPKPDKPGETEWNPSIVELNAKASEIIKNSPLIKYLKNKAEEGGFDKYIEDVLLEEDSEDWVREKERKNFKEDSRKAAARLACDVFLIDKWTRWESLITEEEKENPVKPKLKLQPLDDWGGDPLKNIIEPSFLARLKGVYPGKDSVILDWMDMAFRPEDIFKKQEKEKRVVPSMVTNLKKLSRYDKAVSAFLGTSMATGIATWDRETQEQLPKIAELLSQIYGSKLEDRHLVGAMVMRILYTKALASAVESSKPGFSEKMSIVLTPEDKERPFYGVMHFLYGEKLDAKSGFIQKLTGGRLRLVIKDNKYGAENIYKELWKLLNSNDQTGKTNARFWNTIGFAFDVADAVAPKK